MWAEQLPNGKIRFVERYTNPMTLEDHRVSVTKDKDTTRTRKQAAADLDEKIEKKLSAISTASTVRKKDLRLSDLVELYQTSQKLTCRASTCTRNYHACNSLMRILGKDTVVNRLSAGYVNEKLQAEEESIGTTNERITRLKALIRWGYQNDYIDDIRWIDKLKKKEDNEKKTKLEEKYLERDELQILLRNLATRKWRFLAELTALSGLRVGEAIALLDADVDLKERVIHVTKNYDAVNKLVGYPKNSSSNRDIYIQDELLSVCRKIKTSMRRERLLIGYRTDLFLCDVEGNYLNYYSYNDNLKETARKVLDKNIEITTHVMRHTHTALMAEAEVPLETISRRLGHSNSKITKEIYYHVTKKMKERDNQLIKEVKLL